MDLRGVVVIKAALEGVVAATLTGIEGRVITSCVSAVARTSPARCWTVMRMALQPVSGPSPPPLKAAPSA